MSFSLTSRLKSSGSSKNLSVSVPRHKTFYKLVKSSEIGNSQLTLKKPVYNNRLVKSSKVRNFHLPSRHS